MKRTLLVFLLLLLNSCVIKKEVSISVYDSDNVELDILMQGSDLEDITPTFKMPLIP